MYTEAILGISLHLILLYIGLMYLTLAFRQ